MPLAFNRLVVRQGRVQQGRVKNVALYGNCIAQSSATGKCGHGRSMFVLKFTPPQSKVPNSFTDDYESQWCALTADQGVRAMRGARKLSSSIRRARI